MTQYNSVNLKLADSQLNKLKSATKKETGVTMKLSSNMIDRANDETNFPHKLLLINRQFANHHEAIANNSSGNTKLSKTQISKIIQSGRSLGRPLRTIMKVDLPLMKNVLQPLAKIVLIPFQLTAAATGIHKKLLGWERQN